MAAAVEAARGAHGRGWRGTEGGGLCSGSEPAALAWRSRACRAPMLRPPPFTKATGRIVASECVGGAGGGSGARVLVVCGWRGVGVRERGGKSVEGGRRGAGLEPAACCPPRERPFWIGGVSGSPNIGSQSSVIALHPLPACILRLGGGAAARGGCVRGRGRQCQRGGGCRRRAPWRVRLVWAAWSMPPLDAPGIHVRVCRKGRGGGVGRAEARGSKAAHTRQ